MPHTPECIAFFSQKPPYPPLIAINSLDEIPDFANECEEAIFWQTHSFSEELWESLPEADFELGDGPLEFEWDEMNLGHLGRGG